MEPPPGFEDPDEPSLDTGDGPEDRAWSWEDWMVRMVVEVLGGWDSRFSDWKSQEYEPPQTWDTSVEIFIPEFLAGFLLLHRAGLDAGESEYPGGDQHKHRREGLENLARRDKQKMSAAYVAHEVEDDDEEAWMADDECDIGNLDDESQEIYLAEQDRIQEATSRPTRPPSRRFAGSSGRSSLEGTGFWRRKRGHEMLQLWRPTSSGGVSPERTVATSPSS